MVERITVRGDIRHYAAEYQPRLSLLGLCRVSGIGVKPMAMTDWISALDNQIISVKREVLQGHGKITREQAFKKAEKEFEIYRAREMKQFCPFLIFSSLIGLSHRHGG
jgi:hypothetical protein